MTHSTIESAMPAKPVQPSERIQVLDVLRGIAILGMIIVHFDGYTNHKPNGQLNKIIAEWVGYFIKDRSYTLFAILFGAGFAIQLMSSENRSENFIPRFIRRMFALAFIGFIIYLCFSFSIFYSYALCGFLLILVRNWSTKALLVLCVLCIMLTPLFHVTKNTFNTIVYGTEISKDKIKQRNDVLRPFRVEQSRIDSIENKTGSYITAIELRTELFFYYYQPTTSEDILWLLSRNFMFFLIGFIAIRLRIFQEPGKKRRLIIGLMIFGTIFWVLRSWFVPFFPMSSNLKYPNIPFPLENILTYISTKGFDWVRANWLSFTYAGIVLLLISYNPTKWFKRLSIFSITGRMALTNYCLHAMILNLSFANYAFAFPRIAEFMIPLYSVILFAALVLFSRWWLNRFQFGPLEWLWRSLTYLKFQPMKLKGSNENNKPETMNL